MTTKIKKPARPLASIFPPEIAQKLAHLASQKDIKALDKYVESLVKVNPWFFTPAAIAEAEYGPSGKPPQGEKV